mmetsp:Transcript_51854/g.125725  ORF Transcript_51854/g.125725 Transcript_51854/m.125725 type:complete len:239 (+) Transcript_51854:129-845(+)
MFRTQACAPLLLYITHQLLLQPAPPAARGLVARSEDDWRSQGRTRHAHDVACTDVHVSSFARRGRGAPRGRLGTLGADETVERIAARSQRRWHGHHTGCLQPLERRQPALRINVNIQQRIHLRASPSRPPGSLLEGSEVVHVRKPDDKLVPTLVQVAPRHAVVENDPNQREKRNRHVQSNKQGPHAGTRRKKTRIGLKRDHDAVHESECLHKGREDEHHVEPVFGVGSDVYGNEQAEV